MLVGIDVGGTNTDAVVVEEKRVVAWAKTPTNPDDLVLTLREALDRVLTGIRSEKVQRVVFSTTLITNLIASGKTEPVALLIIPGPGANPGLFAELQGAYLLSGAIDYRGRETAGLDREEAEKVIGRIEADGYRRVAVVGKFSSRNPGHEEWVANLIRKLHPDWKVEMGGRTAGRLGFPRRAATTRLTAAVRENYEVFTHQVEAAVRDRGIQAPILVLKADGGTMPLAVSANRPVETIFSGPAASTMGVLALIPAGETAVVADIGGTTTDLALILSGEPLLASKGARVGGQLTQVRSFATRSIALGGDSRVSVREGTLVIGPERDGPACCLGGPAPTPTDALRLLGLTEIGDRERAETAMSVLGSELGLDAPAAARLVVDQVVDRLAAAIGQMFREWEAEPAYRIWELKQKVKIRPDAVAGVGGGAPAIIPLLADRLGCRQVVSGYAGVANALGAALARPTLLRSLRIDTERETLSVAEEGLVEPLHEKKMTLAEAETAARRRLLRAAAAEGIRVEAEDVQVLYSEVFNMVRGWTTTGRLFEIEVQVPPGLVGLVEQGEGWCGR